ncbi:MAG: hypothetical protein MHMPM18_002237 [Marteilia pararefringens]
MTVEVSNGEAGGQQCCRVKYCRQMFDINLTKLLEENDADVAVGKGAKNLMQLLTLHLQQLTSVSPENQTLIFGKKKFNFVILSSIFLIFSTRTFDENN